MSSKKSTKTTKRTKKGAKKKKALNFRTMAERKRLVKAFDKTPLGERTAFLAENGIGWGHIHYWQNNNE